MAPVLESTIPYTRRMTEQLIKLRYQGTCRACSCPLARGTTAWWDQRSHSLECTTCRPESEILASPPPSPSSIEVDRGIPGGSSQAQFERAHARREREIEQRWGRFAGLVKFLTDDPRSIRAWQTGSVGERKLAASLEHLVADRAVLLNDRRVPGTRGNIDHVAVAPSGVWVIDAKRYKGLIELREHRAGLKSIVSSTSTVGGGPSWWTNLPGRWTLYATCSGPRPCPFTRPCAS